MTTTPLGTEEPLTEMFAFIGSAGYNIREILEYRSDGTVLVLGERPGSRMQHRLETTIEHLVIRIS